MPLSARLAAPFLVAVRGLAELALPATCAACGALTDENEPFCSGCAATLEPIEHACRRCGLPLAGDAVRVDGRPMTPPPPPSAPLCLGCLRAPPPWSEAHAPFPFAGALAVAIRRWKLGPDARLTRALGLLLAPSLARFAACDVLVPVPLHPRRLRSREFNQASLLARTAARRFRPNAPPVRELLDRVIDTPPQATLDAATRRANLRGAFAARRPDALCGAHVCLVDDVLTTGATASACARALLAAGARRVDVLTLARTTA